MYWRKLFLNIYIILFILLVNISFGQNKIDPRDDAVQNVLRYTEKIYRIDDRLVNGHYYVPKHPLALGHPYFINKGWQSATLYIKGVVYEGIQIKYNIEEDIVVYKRQHELGLVEEILLNNTFIDSMVIGQHFFVNTSHINKDFSHGFLERIYSGNFSAYLKHEIIHKDELTHTNSYGRYLDPKKKLLFYAGNDLVAIHDKRSLLDYFSEHKKQIKRFMRKNRIIFHKASNDEYVKLLSYCDGL